MSYKEFKETEERLVNEIKEIINLDRLNTARGSDENAHKRFLLMHFLRDNSTLTFQEIGLLFKKHHSTIIHGIKKHEDNTAYGDKIYLRNTAKLKEYLETLKTK